MIATLLRRELLATARTGQAFRFRMGYGLLILLETITAYLLHLSLTDTNPAEARRPITTLVQTLVIQHVALIFGLAPILAAGSVIPEKSSGTLIELMVTPIRSYQIVLAKWLAIQVRVLDLAIIPVPTAMIVFSYVLIPSDIFTRILLPLLWLPLVVAFGVFASVLMRRVWMAAMVAMGISWLLLGRLFSHVHPEFSKIPLSWESLFVIVFTCVTLGWASLRLRPVAIVHALPETPKKSWIQWQRMPVTDQPIRWLETSRGQRIPLLLLHNMPPYVSVILFGIANGLVLITGLIHFAVYSMSEIEFSLMIAQSGFAIVLLMGLIVASRSALCITNERQQHTFDSLRVTPLTPREIVRGKVWGIVDSMRPMFAIYLSSMIPAVAVVPIVLPIMLVIWLSMWVSTYWWAALGVRESVKRASGLSALVCTIGIGYFNLLSYYLIILIFKGVHVFFLGWILTGLQAIIVVCALSAITILIVSMGFAEIFIQDAISELTAQFHPSSERITARRPVPSIADVSHRHSARRR